MIAGGIIVFLIIIAAVGNSSYSNPQQETQSNSQQNQQVDTTSKKDLMKQNNPNVKQLATLTADYVGKSFTLYVNAEAANYYNYGFRDENKYYSLRLWDDSVEGSFEGVYGYLDKSKLENKDLINSLLNDPAFLKVNASIPTEKYEQGSNSFLQIDSWEEVK